MRLPVAGQEAPAYRERVYCYELYHQLPLALPCEFPYKLSGEADKHGHRMIRGDGLDNAIPDFPFHEAGTMARNLVVMEVKSIVGARDSDGTKKDLKRLCAFRHNAGYHYAIYLIYGDGDQTLEGIREHAVALSRDSCNQEIDLDLIDVYHHRRAGEQAQWLDWE